MSLLIEGQGLSITHGDVSLNQNPIQVEVPGFTRDEIERTTQNNSDVHTKDVATLANYEQFTHQMPYDPADVALWYSNRNTNKQQVITLPNSGGTVTVWAKVLSVGNVSMEGPGARPAYDVTFVATNVNEAGTETAPAFAAGS